MNPEQRLKEATDNVADCQKALDELLEIQKVAVDNQKSLIKVARATARAWQEICDKAKELDKKK